MIGIGTPSNNNKIDRPIGASIDYTRTPEMP